MTVNKYTFIDLFCGCGGFTLGMQRSGFSCLAAIDFDTTAIETLKSNLPRIANPLVRGIWDVGKIRL